MQDSLKYFAFVFLLLLSLVACGSGGSVPATATSTPVQTTLPSTTTSMVRAQTLTPTLEKPAPCVAPISSTLTNPPTVSVYLPILVYHRLEIVPPEDKNDLVDMAVSPEDFEKQVAYLAAHDYHTIYFSELVAYFREGCPLPENPIILTFDDGWVADYTVAFPILKKYGMVGTFFPPTNWVDHDARLVLSWAQIAEMSAGGMEFGSHTQSHSWLDRRTDEQNRSELLNSKRILEEHTGKPVVALAYPGGAFNDDVIKLLEETGYGAAVTTLYGNEQSADEIYMLHRTGLRYDDSLVMFAARLR